MPYDAIKVGDTPNDRTGDPNRNSWIKANAMFQELFSLTAAQATAVNLTAEESARSSADATLAEQVAARATIASVLGKADLTQVPRIDDAIGLTADQRILLGDNTGLQVTVPFILFEADTTPTPATFELPALPGDFRIHSVYVCMNAAGGSVITASLLADDDALIAKADHVSCDVQGPNAAKLSTYQTILFRSKNYRLVVASIDSIAEGYEPHLGLSLWIRGAWSRSMFSSGGGEEGGESESNLGGYGQVLVDFGATLYQAQKVFTITDTRITPQSVITGNVAYKATDDRTLDEIAMEAFDLKFAAGDGQATLLMTCLRGDVHGKFYVDIHIN